MASKLKILHFIWSANFGGIEKLVIDLCIAQNKKNIIESEILIGCPKGSFMKELVNNNIPHFYGNLKNGFDLSPLAYKRIKLKMQEFDVIHIHTFNLLIFKAAVDSGTKIIYTIHGNFNLGRSTSITDRISIFLLKYYLNNKVDFISFNSEFTKKTAIKRYNLKVGHTGIIYNGIPLKNPANVPPIENKAHLGKIEGHFVVGTTCRFNGFKRIDRLIDAFKNFAENKNDVLLLLVGDGVVRKQLEDQVDLAGIRKVTLFTGYQTNVLGYQKRMDVCVFPSENEPFGLVAVETLSMGKPTIIFRDAGGMMEILSGKFPQDIVTDVNSLTQRLESYYLTRNQPDLINENKRKELANHFNIDTMEKCFYEKYLEIIS